MDATAVGIGLTVTLGLLAAVESSVNRSTDPRHLIANPAARHAARPAPGNGEQ
ncbi:hypothetical protein AB0I98_38750 [Streptomyces sp. NPDC050211]|uniref:hypothetical protein n=1 Tax=Streptomyces sp. NPDC050211 TaxID=3154932 RepID=UPI0034157DF8